MIDEITWETTGSSYEWKDVNPEKKEEVRKLFIHCPRAYQMVVTGNIYFQVGIGSRKICIFISKLGNIRARKLGLNYGNLADFLNDINPNYVCIKSTNQRDKVVEALDIRKKVGVEL